MESQIVLWHVPRMGQLVLELVNSRPQQPRFQLQVNPIQANGTFGPDEFIELGNPELEDSDLQTYIKHTVSLLERPVRPESKNIFAAISRNGKGNRTNSPLDIERLEIVLDYLYAELNRRVNGKQS